MIGECGNSINYVAGEKIDPNLYRYVLLVLYVRENKVIAGSTLCPMSVFLTRSDPANNLQFFASNERLTCSTLAYISDSRVYLRTVHPNITTRIQLYAIP